MRLFEVDIGNVSWPSLYNPVIDIIGVDGASPVQPGGKYLTQAHDIFLFTLYWTLIFYVPLYVLVGTYAFFNVLFPSARGRLHQPRFRALMHAGVNEEGRGRSVPMNTLPSLHPDSAHTTALSASHSSVETSSAAPRQVRKQLNVRRTRLLFALIIFLSFVGLSIFSAVTGAAVMGFVTAGVYKAGGFWVSTWVPFVWAVIHALVGLLGVWPSIIEII
ncbi:hypothetical protein EDC04DRAFT_2642383 [Pisolithus marmoratus]|nr:hypothetical protein EDC04DRAFT_2642383 [Pisolithus marmoratus]